MTTAEIKTLIISVDPNAKHRFTMEKGRDYTYWQETHRLPLTSDDEHEEAWAFVVHRFTKSDSDPVAPALFAALDAEPSVTVRWLQDFEESTGYIHHIFDCEGY